MRFMLFIFICILCVASLDAISLPSNFRTCNPNNQDLSTCLADAITTVVNHLTKAIPEIGLPNMSPLEVPSLSIEAGHGAVRFGQNYYKLQITGFKELNCTKAEMNFDAKTLKLVCTTPALKMVFDYEINGKILLLPIRGKGPGKMTIVDLKYVMEFSFEELEVNGTKFYKVVNTDLEMHPKRIIFDLDNLFDGNKVLGNAINRILNNNWRDVFSDVKSGYEVAFAGIFSSIFNNLLEKVPVSELFTKE